MTTPVSTVRLIEVTSEIVHKRYFKHDDPHDRSRITGAGKRSFVDITTKTKHLATEKIETEEFRAHFHRGELRIIVRPASKHDLQRSMTRDEFKEYATRRWRTGARSVLKLLPKE